MTILLSIIMGILTVAMLFGLGYLWYEIFKDMFKKPEPVIEYKTISRLGKVKL